MEVGSQEPSEPRAWAEPAESLIATPVAAVPTDPQWRVAAVAYLDTRSQAWLDGPPQVRNHFPCAMSCHTTHPYLAIRPALGGSPETSVVEQARERLIERVDQDGPWSEQIGFYGRRGNTTWKQSLATEAVLNASALALHDHARGEPLTDATLRALDRMWEVQREDGSWPWLDFSFQPWEAGNDDWGVALAAVATGLANPEYRASHATEVTRLRDFVGARLVDQSAPMELHAQLGVLWASRHFEQLVAPEVRQRIIRETIAAQHDDGGWALAELLTPDRPRRVIARADGYATGLATFVLCSDPSATQASAQGRAWLLANQREDGAWPAWSLNRDRERSHLHMRDAAAAYATLALTSCPPQ